uniref:Uncharacterized protein n=1 Tax=Arundo donax TaxID=35708 RepID=A0A0A9BLW6_ARUDO
MAAALRMLQLHQCPVRRFSLTWLGWCEHFYWVESMLRSQRFKDIQEFEVYAYRPIPLSVISFLPVLRVLCICICSGIEFPAETTCTLSFPGLKQLTLANVNMSETNLQGVLSSCPVLESLLLDGNIGCRRLQISSLTLRNLGVSDGARGIEGKLEELIIKDAPLLERLIPRLPSYGLVIRVIQAPKLKTLGYLHDDIRTLELGTMVFEKMVPVSLSNMMRTVKILALLTAPNLDLVTGFLKCFPCVEKLYIVSYTRMIFKNVQSYAPLECLDRHLKKLQIVNYEKRSDINFIKFFVLHARVLESMKFVVRHGNCDAKWVARQHKKLQVNDRASRGARFDFEASQWSSSSVHMKHIHDLSMDPFDGSLCRCHGDAFL